MAKETNTTPREDMTDRERLAWDYATAFAKAAEAQQRSQVINDPDGKTSRRTTRTYTAPTKDQIDNYLRAPSSNEKNLRNASIYLYQINTRYRNLLNYYANLPCWSYVITPANYKPKKSKRDSFRNQYFKVCNILESMSLEKIMREVVVAALREGVYYGVIWGGNGDNFILQKLDPDNCTICSITDGGVFQFKYDMTKIKEADVDTYYPPAFKEMYNEYKKTGEKYQTVPSDIAVCFKADPSVVEYSIPVFSGVMPTLFQIENVKALATAASEIANYKLIAGKIPVDDEGVPLIDWQTVMQYYNHLANNVGDRVGVAFTPFDLKDFNFDRSGATAQTDEVSRANDNFFAEAGTSALLHGATNDTSGVTKLAIKVDEAYAFGLMYQAENIVNKFLKRIAGTVKFKIRFLEVSQFNREDKIGEYRNAMNYGIGKLEYLALMGIHQFDILGENYIEQDLLGLDDLYTPMRTASTQSAEQSGNSGRPRLNDGKISDEGEETRDNDEDANR